MEQKVDTIKDALQKGFPGSTISYLFASELHKFRIESAGPTYWLYVDREYLEDSDMSDLINALRRRNVVEALMASKRARWLFLDDSGLYDVDENFGK